MTQRSRLRLAYVFLAGIIILSSFEFFFREDRLVMLLGAFSIPFLFVVSPKIRRNNTLLLFLILLIFFPIVQLVFGVDINILSHFIKVVGFFSIALICKDYFLKCYLNIIYVICIYSLFIWLLCFIEPFKNFLIQYIAPFCQSLNIEQAMQDGGGINIIIYNFQVLSISDIIGFSRNCGPFWEPGMFAVYIIIGLALYNFFYNGKIKYFNQILVLTLISTASTGGIMSGAFLIILFLINSQATLKKKIPILFLLALTIVAINEYEFIGNKTLEQLENSETGSDKSRFGAMRTQLLMIESSPFIGGEDIQDYTTGKTLASGTLIPFVEYGILGGLLFYVCMLISFVRFAKSYGRKSKYGLELFLLIGFLAISQTIITKPFIMILIFSGLLRNYGIVTNYAYLKNNV